MIARTPLTALAALALSALLSAQHNPLFDAPLLIANSDERAVKTLDLNGDGWADAVGWWNNTLSGQSTSTGKLVGWINDGAGHLVHAWNTPLTLTAPPDRCPRRMRDR